MIFYELVSTHCAHTKTKYVDLESLRVVQIIRGADCFSDLFYDLLNDGVEEALHILTIVTPLETNYCVAYKQRHLYAYHVNLSC